MIVKLGNELSGRKLLVYYSTWIQNNRVLRGISVIIIGLAIFVYGLVCAIDAVSGCVIQRNNKALDPQTESLDNLVAQVEQLRLDAREREATLSRMNEWVRSREGRLIEKHVAPDNGSRLVANTSFSGAREVASPSRSYSRYSPFHFDVTLPSSVTAYELEQVFEHTELRGLGRSFIQAELKYGINAVFLAALAIHESHWGNSALARDKNNLYGFGAYDVNPYLHGVTFSSKHECILQVAEFIRENYVSGQYSNGRNIADINRLYASDEQWSHKIFMLMLQIDDDIQSASA